MVEAQVYNHWSKASEAIWKLDQDQVESAKKLVARAAGKEVEVIAMHAEPGMAAIGFALKEPLEFWGEEMAEIVFDGTCMCTALRSSFGRSGANYLSSQLIQTLHITKFRVLSLRAMDRVFRLGSYTPRQRMALQQQGQKCAFSSTSWSSSRDDAQG